jgi:peptide/nickel transport system permease protein
MTIPTSSIEQVIPGQGSMAQPESAKPARVRRQRFRFVRNRKAAAGLLILGVYVLLAIIGLTSWSWNARVLRAQTLSLRRRDFVEASRASGERTWRIIGFELLPNLTAVIASGFVGTVIFAVLSEITLAFIGVVNNGWNWGTILFWAQGQQALGQDAWWWFVPAGLAIALLGMSLSLINFGIDEFVSPRLRSAGKTKVRTTSGRTVRMRIGFTPVLSGAPVVEEPARIATPVAREAK